MRRDYLILVVFSSLLACNQGLSQTAPKPFLMDARLNKESDGTVTIMASSPRPLWQALEAVKRRYGWTLDYEDPLYQKNQIVPGPGKISVLKGGTFTVHLREPASNTAAEEQRVLNDLVTQFNAESSIQYRVIPMSDYRYDISPISGSALDQPIVIDGEQRSLREEVDAILASFTKTTGISAVQGGLMMNAMEQTEVSLNHTGTIPMRQLLKEVLDRAPREMSWLFTYEPNGGYFAIGIQPTQQLSTTADGKTIARTFANPHLSSANN